MSGTASSRTKTLTESTESESSVNPQATDRWTNNISYHHLVASSCIGIVQLWWHPYLHDLSKLLPFLFLYNVFSMIVGYPMFYLELALGMVTKKGVINCWDLAPAARGVGFAMLATSAFTAMALSAVAAWSLALCVHSLHSFVPWLHCAASARPACAARHRPLPRGADTAAQSFLFNFVLNLKRDGLAGGMGTVVWELAVYYIICWLIIYCIAIKRIYSYSKLVMFKDVLAFFVLLSCVVGAARLRGAGTMFRESDWSVLFTDIQIWRESIEYALIEMSISQGSLVMLGAHCPPRAAPARAALAAYAAAKCGSLAAAATLGATHGALRADYDNSTGIWRGPPSSMVLWADFVARVPGSQFWSALVFFTLFVLALTSTALLVLTIMSTLTGHSVRKVAWAFLILLCTLFCLIGVIMLCTQGGLYIVSFLFTWPALKTRVFTAAALSGAVTYVYGQKTFCEDLYFTVGEYPNVFLRVCWALMPGLLLVIFFLGLGGWSPAAGSLAGSLAGAVLAALAVAPALLITLFYLVFKCRVRTEVFWT